MEKFTTIIKPLFNPVNGTPFVLGPQGPYSSKEEAITALLQFYETENNIPGGQSVIINDIPYSYNKTNKEFVLIENNPCVIVSAGDSNVLVKKGAVFIPKENSLELKISTGLNVDDAGYLYINYDKLAEALYTRMTNIAAAKASETE